MAVWKPYRPKATPLMTAPKTGPKGAPVLKPPSGGGTLAGRGFGLPQFGSALAGGLAGPKPAVPVVPPAAAAPAAPAAPGNAWQDSTYNSSVANLLQGRDAGNAALDALGRRAVEDRDVSLGQLGEGRVKAKTGATQSANKQGLLYSGALGKNLGDVDTSYGQQENAVNTAYARGEQDRATTRAGLQTTFDQGNTAASGSAWDRYVAAAAASEAATTPGLADLVASLGQQFAAPPALVAPAKKPAAKKPVAKKKK